MKLCYTAFIAAFLYGPMNTPSDLIPLPTMPWDTRPSELPLDVEECRTALWRNRGNITKAAAMLKVPSERLRRFVRQSPRLSAEVDEVREQLLDKAEDNMAEALDDLEDATRRDIATKFVLKELGGRRGYGTSGSKISIHPGEQGGRMVIEWGSPDDDANDGPVIDHE